MSRKFRIHSDGETVTAVGTPADIRKVIRRLEEQGMYNLFCGNPVMREGRTYAVSFPESPCVGNRAYTVGRA